MHQIRFHALPLLSLLLATPVTLFAASVATDDPTLWDQTMKKSEQIWDATREGTEKGVDWTVEKSGQAWEATKDGTAKGVEWTREKSGQAWEATKDGAAEGSDWIRGKITPDESNENVKQPATTDSL